MAVKFLRDFGKKAIARTQCKPYLANSHWGLGFRFISYLPITSAKQRNINRSWKGYIHRRYAALISLEQPGLTVSL